MSDEIAYQYAVVRYVPRPDRGEFVNIGVVVVGPRKTDVATEFTNDWRRARSLGRAEDVAWLRKLGRHWKRSLRSSRQLELLAPNGGALDASALERLAGSAANVIQLSEPRRALGESASSLAGDLFDSLVGEPRRAKSYRGHSKRGLQLAFEGQLRRRGLGGVFERGFPAPGMEVTDWMFDYALKNGRPLHLVQTVNLSLHDTKTVLSEVAYVAYAHRDLRATRDFGDVPVSVLAEGDDGSERIVEEARALLGHDEIPLYLRGDVPAFVDRLSAAFGSSLTRS